MELENGFPRTLVDAIRYFMNPDVSLAFMVELRWPDGVKCPRCGSREVRFLAKRRIWECKAHKDKRQFSAKTGTIFEDSPLPLDKWLAAVWLIANAKNGISSYEIHRAIGVTQKTAWFMLHRIRLALTRKGEAEAWEAQGAVGWCDWMASPHRGRLPNQRRLPSWVAQA